MGYAKQGPLVSAAPTSPSDDGERTDTDTIAPTRPSSPAPTPVRSSSTLYNHLMADVKLSLLTEVELILLTFCTGIQDAASFPDYRCYTSNQTGNTIFLLLALVLPGIAGKLFITANIGASLGFFLAGAWVTGQLSHAVGPCRRLWLIASNIFQACLVFAAAGIQFSYGVNLQGSRSIGIIGLLAFSSGSQIVQSRSLQVAEINTAIATAAWVDTMAGSRMFDLKNNRPQARRVAFLLTLMVGVLVGAAIYHSAGSAVALFISAAGKLLVALIYFFNASEKPKVEESKV